jgi:hypothetical protein
MPGTGIGVPLPAPSMTGVLSTIAMNCWRLCPGLQIDIVKSFVQDAYGQLVRMDWQMLKLSRQLTTTAPYSTGHVTIDSAGVVSGTLTVFTSAMVGRWMKVHYADSIFKIASYSGPTSITLEDWTGETLSTVHTYTIFKTIYRVPIEMRMLFDVAYQTSLPKKSQYYFNSIDPSKTSSGTPLYWADAGVDSSSYLLIEIYPYPDAVYPLRLYGKSASLTLAETDTPIIASDLIEALALISCFRMKDSLQPKSGWDGRLAEQLKWYSELLELNRYEDYSRSAHHEQVKDYMGGEDSFPPSSTFAANHDVE